MLTSAGAVVETVVNSEKLGGERERERERAVIFIIPLVVGINFFGQSFLRIFSTIP